MADDQRFPTEFIWFFGNWWLVAAFACPPDSHAVPRTTESGAFPGKNRDLSWEALKSRTGHWEKAQQMAENWRQTLICKIRFIPYANFDSRF